MAARALPLQGLRVLEMGPLIAGPFAGCILGYFGAEVIKIEPPIIGDPMRYLGSQKNGVSALFHNCNRGKRGLAIDLKDPIGVEAVKRLATRADILLNNYRPGVMDKLGLGSDVLRSLNPKLINVAVTGFGTTGPMADRPAYDHVIQGISGITALQGGKADDGSDQFAFVRQLMCDKLTAYTVAQAATAALVARAHTGEGQHIDISMLHACLAFMWPDGMMHQTLLDEDALDLPPMSETYQTIQTKDGAVAASALTDQHWDAILTLLNREDLKTDPRFESLPARMSNMAHVMSLLKDGALHLSVDEVMTAFEAADIPSAKCERRTTLVANAQIQAIGALETYVTQNIGRLTAPTPPALFAGAPTSLAEASPNHGQHSREIMRELGFDKNAINALAESGALAG